MKPGVNRILITGAGGFIGSGLLRKLAQAPNTKVFGSYKSVSGPDSVSFPCDLMDSQALSELIDFIKPTTVVQAAGVRPQKSTGFAVDGDLKIAQNLLMALRRTRVKPNLIAIGSCAEYGAAASPYLEETNPLPSTPYGQSKFKATEFLLNQSQVDNQPVILIRPSVVYGEGQPADMFIPSLISAIRQNRKVLASPGFQKRDFVHVEDVVDAIVACLEFSAGWNGMVLNIATGQSRSLREVADVISKQVGRPVDEFVDFGAFAYSANEVMDYRVSVSKAENIIKWTPKITLESGIQRILKAAGDGDQ